MIARLCARWWPSGAVVQERIFDAKVRSTSQPGGLAEAVGATYSQFVILEKVSLKGEGFANGRTEDGRWWMELLQSTTATVVARYDHPVWGKYAAVTRNQYGKGEVTYVGFMPSDEVVGQILGQAVQRAGVRRLGGAFQDSLIVRGGMKSAGAGYPLLVELVDGGAHSGISVRQGNGFDHRQSVDQGNADHVSPWGVVIGEDAVAR